VNAGRDPVAVVEEEDFISLAPVWSLVRRYRFWLEIAFFSLTILAGGLLAAGHLLLPRSTKGSLNLVFNFAGASSGKYPNNTPFLPAHLLSPEVLRPVYEANHLENYLKFDDFKTALSLEEAGDARTALLKEFSLKLDDRKLTLAERQRLEEEFQRRRSDLQATEYRLLWRQKLLPAKLVPAGLQQKVLEDIPRQWAEDAVSNKKVLIFSAILPSRIQSENSEDKIVANSIDVGERIRACGRGLNELGLLPGSAFVRLADGTNLVDLKIRLQVLREGGLNKIRYSLQQLVQAGMERSRLESLLQARLRARQKLLITEKGKLQPQEEAYRDYLASRPGNGAGRSGSARSLGSGSAGTTLQLSDAFLGKWMEMTKSSADELYRQELVERVVMGRDRVLETQASVDEMQVYLKDLSVSPDQKDPGTAKMEKDFNAATQKSIRDQGDGKNPGLEASRIKALQAMQDAATELNAIIVAADELRSILALNYQNPQTSLYGVSVPFQLVSTSLLSPRNSGLFLAGFVLVGLAITLLICWGHDQSIKPQE